MEVILMRKIRKTVSDVFIKEDLIVIPGILCVLLPLLFDDPVFKDISDGVGVPIILIWYFLLLFKLKDRNQK